MKTFSLSLALVATTLFVGACTDGTETDGTETGETESGEETDTEETDVEDTDTTPTWDTTAWSNWGDAVDVSCTGDGTEGTTNITLRTDNWGYNAVIYIADTRYGRDYDEEHTLEITDESEDATGYSVFERELTNKTVPNVPDQSTLFDCWDFDQADADERSVSIAAAVYDIDDNLTDCIVFGQDPQQILDGNISGGTVSIPSWIDGDCRIVGN